MPKRPLLSLILFSSIKKAPDRFLSHLSRAIILISVPPCLLIRAPRTSPLRDTSISPAVNAGSTRRVLLAVSCFPRALRNPFAWPLSARIPPPRTLCARVSTRSLYIVGFFSVFTYPYSTIFRPIVNTIFNIFRYTDVKSFSTSPY